VLLVFAACLTTCAAPAARADQPSLRRVSAGVVEIGRENWGVPWLPDLRDPAGRVPFPPGRTIDVVILGDGFLPSERTKFEYDARLWYKRLLRFTPYQQLRGAFRVRAVWTPSSAHCSPERNTYYRLGAEKGFVTTWNGTDTRRAVFATLDGIGVNPMQRGTRLTHTFVAMLVRDAPKGDGPSGIARTLYSPDRKRSVRMAMGEHVIHEFTHAYAGVDDEYIRTPETGYRGRTSPREPSIFSLSNLVYSRDPARIPWMHYAPGGEINPDKNSVVGLLWVGGEREHGVWHSQARCLMNGLHGGNWDYARTRRGANLRNFDGFCFWCQEIIAAKTYQKAGSLGDDKDGVSLWKRWAAEFRPLYLRAFDVPARIRALNSLNAKARLADAKIYERPVTPGATAAREPDTKAPDDEPDDPEEPNP
jgi:hypothetical protein